MGTKSTTKAKDMGVVKYTIHNVAGDGHCFYRALFQILRDTSLHLRDVISISGIEDEDDGVAYIRQFVAKGIRSRKYIDTITTIDSLCTLISDASMDDRTMLSDQLSEMYPFINDSVCSKKGVKRYKEIADMVADMANPMYASSMEIDQMKQVLSAEGVSLLTISANGQLRTAERKFNHDLGKLLENTHTRHVAVLLNRNNVHYQYLMFKAPDDDHYHSIVDRSQLLRLIRMTEIVKGSDRLALLSGGKKTARK